MCSIAIVGTEGSGKTVLLTVLAKACAKKRDAQSYFMDPQDAKTAKYVEHAWGTIKNGEWPPSTSPGELFNLRWKLHVNSQACDIRLLDIAGQDLRRLFADDQIDRVDSLHEQLRKLAEYLQSAEIVLFLINLKDFEGEADSLKKLENQWAIKYAMDWLAKQPDRREFALVFTQADLYREYGNRPGGWSSVAEQYLNFIYGAHLQGGNVPIFPVSAIPNTKVVVGVNSVPRRVPELPFRPQGLGGLLKWISTKTQVRQEANRAAEAATVLLNNTTTSETWWSSAIGWVIIALMAMMFMSYCRPKSEIKPRPPVQKPEPVRPSPTMASWNIEKQAGLLDHWVVAKGSVRNNGATGKVILYVWAYENENLVDEGSQVFWLNQKETQSFSISLYKVYNIRNRIEVKYRFTVPGE